MSLTLTQQVKKIINHADENGMAAISEEEYNGYEDFACDKLVAALIKAVSKRNKGDILIAIGPHGNLDLTDGMPDDGLAEIMGGGCGSAYGSLIYLLISFTGTAINPFVTNEMKNTEPSLGREGAGKRAWVTRRINALKREYDSTPTAGKKSAITKRIKKMEMSR